MLLQPYFTFFHLFIFTLFLSFSNFFLSLSVAESFICLCSLFSCPFPFYLFLSLCCSISCILFTFHFNESLPAGSSDWITLEYFWWQMSVSSSSHMFHFSSDQIINNLFGSTNQRANIFCSTWLRPLLHCICKILCMSTRWVGFSISTVHELSIREEKKSRLSRDSNPGLLAEKCKRFLCTMQSSN